jgi:hypothetical protein
MLSAGAMARFASIPVDGCSWCGLLAVDGLHELVVISLMAAFAGFRTNKP